jgi:cytochrome c-type biogenesis protein CcmH/NrfG
LSFTRCIQQDPEMGEAWANMGAVHYRRKDYTKAYNALTEALKLKNNSWKILENLVLVTLYLSK